MPEQDKEQARSQEMISMLKKIMKLFESSRSVTPMSLNVLEK